MKKSFVLFVAFLAVLMVLSGCNCGQVTAPPDGGVVDEGGTVGASCMTHQDCNDRQALYCRPDPAARVGEISLKCGSQNPLGAPCRIHGGTIPAHEECASRVCERVAGQPFGRCVESLPEPVCSAGQTQQCYTGPAGTEGRGQCSGGQQICVDGKWGPCTGQTLPLAEVCGNGRDDDCNGLVDIADPACQPQPVCVFGQSRQCWENEATQRSLASPCKAGTQLCQNGQWGVCQGQVKPTGETCNNKDDDCDGRVDNQQGSSLELTKPCQGKCLDAGVQKCVEGTWVGVCVNTTVPETADQCDGKDNDCDGVIDEGCACRPGQERPCYTGKAGTQDFDGCKSGVQACNGGFWSAQCVGQSTPKTEVCNGTDDDCDGSVDNVPGTKDPLTITCQGPCGDLGRSRCEGGKYINLCAGVRTPATTEICGNGSDDDCNGQIDETPFCTCVPGTQQSCGTGGQFAPCKKGVQTCLPHGRGWSLCVGEVKPTGEICNGRDDDCNGKVDDGITARVCKGCNGFGLQSCVQGQWGACSAPGPQAEVCGDGLDNDCNGQIDDNVLCTCTIGAQRSCFGGAPANAGRGDCKMGTQTCVDGKVWTTCVGSGKPSGEVCDGKDNDCDGSVDENITQPCGNAGTNGVGICKQGTQVCNNGTWGVCVGEVKPATEVCGNAIDDNCDGNIDENCPCTSGQQRNCFDGNPALAGIGVCSFGTQVCQNGQWAACQGSGKPITEICGDGIDNDCDGQTEEGCQCAPGKVQACYTGPTGTAGRGTCTTGMQACLSNAVWGPCVNDVTPAQELCDGKDNDCDGRVDGHSQNCYMGTTGTLGRGACKGGQQTCNNGQWTACQNEVTPKTEICNGIDDDCDGTIDNIAGTGNALSQSCYTGAPNTKGVGTCRDGFQVCSKGAWGACQSQVIPVVETCDGRDNDCNGKIDDKQNAPFCQCQPGTTQSCYTGPVGTAGKGACKQGLQRCNAQGQWGACEGEVVPQPEQCDNIDHDCDGKVNNALVQGTVITRQCYPNTVVLPNGSQVSSANFVGVGACVRGTDTCQSDGKWSGCQNFKLPTAEVCDGKDNDCDGGIDENVTRKCYRGLASARGKGICSEGIETCIGGNWSICAGDVFPQQETCNNRDDDCDGLIDNIPGSSAKLTLACYTGPNGTAGFGLCKAGVRTCTNGQFGACQGQVTPTTEVCDNKDNDCDGLIDENITRSCFTGPAGARGVGACKDGVQVCAAGNFGSCLNEVVPKPEVCNNIDDDCNGVIDDNCTQP